MKTKIYLVENCYGDPNKVYIGKEKTNKYSRSRKGDHKKTYGNDISFTYIDEIDSFDRKYWKPLECFWIEYFRQLGFDLQNKNFGGGGPEFQSKKAKEKISAGQLNKIKKRIIQYSLDGSFIKVWDSFNDVEKYLGFIKSVQKCCRGELKTSHGYIWRYENNPLKDNYVIPTHKKAKSILQYNMDGILIKEWDSISLASKELNLCGGNIVNCLKGLYKHTGGYIWKYK